MKKGHVFALAALVFLLVGAQPSTQKPERVSPDKTADSPSAVAPKKDSMIKAANAELDDALQFYDLASKKKDVLIKSKEEQQKAIREYISIVNKSLQELGRKEVVIIRKSVAQQLRDGELALIKDSICIKQKKKFLSKKTTCTKWEYFFLLEDNKGHREKL